MVKNNKKTFHKWPWNNLYSSWKNFSANCGVFVSLANTYYTWKYSLLTIAKKTFSDFHGDIQPDAKYLEKLKKDKKAARWTIGLDGEWTYALSYDEMMN